MNARDKARALLTPPGKVKVRQGCYDEIAKACKVTKRQVQSFLSDGEEPRNAAWFLPRLAAYLEVPPLWFMDPATKLPAPEPKTALQEAVSDQPRSRWALTCLAHPRARTELERAARTIAKRHRLK